MKNRLFIAGAALSALLAGVVLVCSKAKEP
jgi:hypothetical protein